MDKKYTVSFDMNKKHYSIDFDFKKNAISFYINMLRTDCSSLAFYKMQKDITTEINKFLYD